MIKHKNKSLLLSFALVICLSVFCSMFFFAGRTAALGHFTLTIKLTGNGITPGNNTTVTAAPDKVNYNSTTGGLPKNFKLTYSNGSYTGTIVDFRGAESNAGCNATGESTNNKYVIQATGNLQGTGNFDLNCYDQLGRGTSATQNLAVQTSAGSGVQTALTGNLTGKLSYTVNGKNVVLPDGSNVNLFATQADYNNATSLTDTSGGALFHTATSNGDGSFSFKNIDLGRSGSKTFFFESYYNDASGVAYLTGGNVTLTGGVQTLPANLSVLTTQTNCTLNATNNTACGAGGTTAPSCETSGGPLSWAFCGIIEEIAAGEQALENVVSGMLKPPPITFSSSDQIFAVWSSFRIYGNILVVVALLAAIIAEAVGGGLIEAYTVKKMLPRILLAVILINLSIYIVAGLIDITNVVANGISDLISQPFKATGQWYQSFGGISGSVGLATLLGAGAATFWIGGPAVAVIMLFVILPLFLAVLGVIFTLTLRIAILTFLIMIAPVAFALYVLPNTEQYFKKWWDLLFKTLLVYPIVMIVFAMCNVGAVVMSQMTSGQEWLNQLMAAVVRIAPLFLIPFAFKMAGGLTGSIYGAIANTNKKITEGIKGNPNDRNSLRNKVKRGLGEDLTFKQQKAIGTRDYKGRRFRGAVSRAADLIGNNDNRVAGYNKEAAERREALSSFGNDDLLYAGAGYSLLAGQKNFDGTTVGGAYGERKYFNSKGKEISNQLYNKGKSLYGGSQHAITQGLAYTTQKALTNNDAKAMSFAFDRNAEEGKWDEGQIKGNWLGATYPHKGQFGALRYAEPSLDASTGRVVHKDIGRDDDAYGKYLRDTNVTRPSFRLSDVRTEDWEKSLKNQKRYESVLASGGSLTDEQAQNLAMTYELFDAASHEMQTQAGLAAGTGGASDTQVTASGVSASAGPIVEAAKKERMYDLQLTDSNTFEKAIVTRSATVPPGYAGPVLPSRTLHGGIYTSGDNLK
ncbi:MAG TPA: hypothetical protein VIH90_06230 [Candidatus Saccharimonadales bacterium]